MKNPSSHVPDVKQASIAHLDPQFAIAPIIGYRVQAAVTTLDPLSLEDTTQISYECLIYHKVITNYTSGNVPFFNGKVLIKKQNEKPFIEEVLIQAHSIGDAFCDVFESYQDVEDFFILGITKSQIIRIMSTTTIVNE